MVEFPSAIPVHITKTFLIHIYASDMFGFNLLLELLGTIYFIMGYLRRKPHPGRIIDNLYGLLLNTCKYLLGL
jgi:hypothetical protein